MPFLRANFERIEPMSFHRWLRNLFGKNKAAISHRPVCRLAVETFEDRLVPATLSVSDASLIEGHAGTTNALVTVRLTGSSNPNVSVKYSTASGSAFAGSDYQFVSVPANFGQG